MKGGREGKGEREGNQRGKKDGEREWKGRGRVSKLKFSTKKAHPQSHAHLSDSPSVPNSVSQMLSLSEMAFSFTR